MSARSSPKTASASARTADGARHGGDRLVLARDAPSKRLLEREKPSGLARRHALRRHARPLADHGCDVPLRHLPASGYAHGRGGLVQEVDGLVRQVPLAYIPRGEAYRGPDRALGYREAVVALQPGQQGLEHGRAGALVRLRNRHGLEAPLERGVPFDVAAILLRRRRAYDLYLAAAQGGLEDVRRVQRALGGARADYGVQLVDEDYDVPCPLRLAQHVLEPLLEVAAVLRAR